MRNNLQIDGITEHEGETSKGEEEKVQSLFREKLGIENDIEIERAHQTGKNMGRSRTIVMKVLRYKDKTKSLKKRQN